MHGKNRQQIEEEALTLPASERARLAERLLESLDTDPEIEEAWKAEIRHRLEAYRRGDISTVSEEAVLSKARRILER